MTSTTISVDPSISNVIEHCDMMSTLYSDLRDEYYDLISNYCQQKLWHQLTQTILKMVLQPFLTLRSDIPRNKDTTADATDITTSTTTTNSYVLLYEHIVLPFYHKLHPLSTSRIAFAVANTLIVSLNENNVSVSDREYIITSSKSILHQLILNYQEKLNEFIADSRIESTFTSYRSATSSTNRQKDTKQNLMEAIIYLQSKYYLLIMYIKTNINTDSTDDMDMKQKHEIVTIMKKNAKILKEWSTSASTTAVAATSTTGGMTNAAIVQSSHYECCMTYYKMIGPPELFYEQAMQFLTYSPPPVIVTNEDGMLLSKDNLNDTLGIVVNYHQLAIDLCLSALTGDGVYNLVELESTPCLLLLKDSIQYNWLIELLHVVSYGKVLEFRTLIQKYATQIASQPILTLRSTAIEEKLILMALMEYIVSVSNQKTRSSSTNGTNNTDNTATIITLSDIALALHITTENIDQVEYIIMRACSVQLLTAYIDQVDEIVYIQSIQPRVLNIEQMNNLALQFHHWSSNVTTIESYMKDNTTTLFA